MNIRSHSSVVAAVAALASGGIVVVSDEESRENEADLVMAAVHADAASVGFIVRHSGGVLCVPMSEERAGRLGLPRMVAKNADPHGTAFTVSVDSHRTGTGISATDRAATVRALAEEGTAAEDLRRPGHVFPLVARAGGVLKRAGHTEAAVDLCRLAGLAPVGLISELVGDDGEPLNPSKVAAFARRHRLVHVTIEQLQRHLRTRNSLVTRASTSVLPTRHGVFEAHAYISDVDGLEHLALTMGDVSDLSNDAPVLVRVHSECLTGDVMESQRCDCGPQLTKALELIGQQGRGVVVYLRGHEGRGVGLAHKLRAYSLQDQGRDTVDANLDLGLPVDSRDYGVGAAILADLGVREMRLLTNNPAKYSGLAAYELRIVERVPLLTELTPANLRYLTAKRNRLGHDIALPACGTGNR